MGFWSHGGRLKESSITVRQQNLLSRLKSALHQVLVMNKLMDGGPAQQP
jgi:hypothetical protein